MDDVKIVGTYDVTELVFLAFTLFFIVLVFYLRREDRREGYPLEDEVTGRLDTEAGPMHSATGKTFIMPFGRDPVTTPTKGREKVDVAGERTFRSPGAPYYPTGNPLEDGLGPAAWADRAKHPDLDAEGHNRIVPISTTPSITVHKKDSDPRGMTVLGADGEEAGTVTDIWIDRAEHQIRYLEVDTGTNKVLAPMAMSVVRGKNNTVIIDALNAADFAAAPVPAKKNEITFYEEERVVAYFGGGYLYANRERQEPLL
ncbi:photosynthetic reaction center subunit H [Pontixanthobacter aestiaquae]|uniref:Photosynthetic reaction center subunit H n=1 Tax=Pontixanthobacter aestiaquae TaxID=1509367 RepID=A0A844ZAI3_9SPHN|nr:photosynthetic reaction center subunit H [Pontixanthobacter aestiaquae]MDN3644787.1 photosynthetic reaction center subunit H [Pontixanthobacter aestiaquae]MXO84206.1 photosynthetic reaction center subunit H [Pontixanthobacter aestiaquae]